MKKINNSKDLFEEVKKDFDSYQEKVTLVGVNTKNEILYKKVVFQGGVDSSIIDKRIIFKELFLNNCSRFFLAHNHPSGNVTPSKEDFEITKKLIEAGKIMDLELLDHLVYSDKEFHSLRDYDEGGF